MRQSLCNICLVLLLLCSQNHKSWAQEYITYYFEAVVTTIAPTSDIFPQLIEKDDIISGTVTFDNALKGKVSGPNLHVFQFTDESSNMRLHVGGVEFVSKTSSMIYEKNHFFLDVQGRESRLEKGLFQSRLIEELLPFNPEVINASMTLSLDARGVGGIVHDPPNAADMPDSVDFEHWHQQKVVGCSINILHGESVIDRFAARIVYMSRNKPEGVTFLGRVMSDYNANCSVDVEDRAMPRLALQFQPGDYSAYTKLDGSFALILPEGEYEMSVANVPNWALVCNGGSNTVTVGPDKEPLEIKLTPTELYQALTVSLGGHTLRPGFVMPFSLNVFNSGTLPYTGYVHLRHDSLFRDFKSEPAAETYNDLQASWFVEDLPINAGLRMSLEFALPPDERLLGKYACFEMEADLAENITDPEILGRSQRRVCREIRGAYDPNDIQVFTGLRNADGPILPDEKVLNYLIRFQNEGNEDAITVRVVDRLSKFLRLDRLELGAASHDFDVNITAGGNIEWVFNDINLPPKSLDETASQGFVEFEIQLKDDLPVGTSILNQAEIYFDFNSPVMTNTVESRITNVITAVAEQSDTAELSLYPNPAGEQLYIKLPPSSEATIKIISLLGGTVLQEQITAQASSINISDLAIGHYLVVVQRDGKSSVEQLNVVR